jgi:signal transduction histidine kinase
MYQARFAVQAQENSFPQQGAGVAVLPGRGSECERANSADRVREAILANMSHELRTPLHSVLMALNQAREALVDTPLADLCSQALVSGYRLNTLLGDILELASLESGAARSQNAEFKPGDLCTEVVDLFKLTAREKQIALATYHEKDIPAVVVGDASRLRVVLMHIIGNALKFTKTGTVALHLGVASKLNPGPSRQPYTEAPQKPTHPKPTPIPPHI